MADEPVDVTATEVVRQARPWSATGRRLLRHLDERGVRDVPSPSARSNAREDVVGFLAGDSMDSVVFSRSQAADLARLLRAVHDAATDFVMEADDVWQPFEFRSGGEPRSSAPVDVDDVVIGHGDTGPWNVISTPRGSVALIDWEFAGPIRRVDELAATAWLNFRFHDPRVDSVAPLNDLTAKVSLLAAFLDAYGLKRSAWTRVVGGMADYAIRDAAYEAERLAVSPDVVPAEPSTAWRLAWRSRSAAWLVRNRDAIERELVVAP